MTAEEINRAIVAGMWTSDELAQMLDSIKYARTRLANRNKIDLRIGCPVTFTSSKNNRTVRGTVEKIMQKNVIVSEPGYGRWRVPAAILNIES